MVLAELLKRPVGDKRVDDSQLARRNPGLYLGHGYAQKVGWENLRTKQLGLHWVRIGILQFRKPLL